ncbi:hypothetical protein [Halonatronum saccharophilum]|uniref:hypothetical protein n=1 Tax=Halonatronum saccharophilum TaxID=150060 RepID=UPI000487B00F|nr:hypothetical protein [Halonatronum saccharophilum]
MSNEDMLKLILGKFDNLEREIAKVRTDLGKEILELKNNQQAMQKDLSVIKDTVAENREILLNHPHETGKIKLVKNNS